MTTVIPNNLPPHSSPVPPGENSVESGKNGTFGDIHPAFQLANALCSPLHRPRNAPKYPQNAPKMSPKCPIPFSLGIWHSAFAIQ
jgi:hypothetical protein